LASALQVAISERMNAPIDSGVPALFVAKPNRCVASRGNDRCLIIKGVLLLDALTEVQGRKLGYLVFVENIRPPTAHVRPRTDSELKDAREFSLTNQVARYFGRAKPKERANFVLSWHEPTP
jgi:hypothetical protein